MTRMMTKAMRVRPGAVLLFVSALLVGLCSWVSGASEAEAPVAIVVSEASRAYYDGQGWVGAYDRIVNSMKLSLEEAGIRYNLLSTDDVVSGKLQGYRVASLMTNASMSRPEVVAIRRFVQAGGKILGAYEVSQLDERQQPAGDAQLGEIFGIKVIGWDRGKYDYIRALDRSHPIFAGLPEFIATARSMTFVVEPIRGGKAIGAWYRADRQTPSRPHPQDAAVVITESSVYVGENIFDRANDDPMLRFLIANMIRYLLGVSPPVSDFRTERAERELKEAEAALEAAQSAYRAIPVEAVKEAMIQAQLELGEARKAFQAGNEEEGAKRSEAAMEKARVARLKTMESPSVELRAIWVDYQSIQQAANRQGVASLMDKIAQAGFNAIYPEVFYQGGSIYPSQVAYQHEEYRSWTEDPMQVIVDEAHKRGLAVYPWVWAFCAGFGKPGPVLERHPEWAELNRDGGKQSPRGDTFWLQASRPEVRKWLVDVYVDLVTRYEVEGLHLDYIRYEDEAVASFGYSPYTREAFKKEYGKDPIGFMKYTDDYQAWNAWREKQVTSLVAEAVRRVHQVRPGLVISAAVMPDLFDARRSKMQNWKHWADNKYVAYVKPMIYTEHMDTFRRLAREGRALLEDHALSYPGIYVYNRDQVMSQIQAARELGVLGICVFSTLHMPQELYGQLAQGPFRTPASMPHADPYGGAVALLRELNNRVQVVIDGGGITITAASALLDAVEEAEDKLRDAAAGEEPDVKLIQEALEKMLEAKSIAEKAAANGLLKPEALKRIDEDLGRITSLVRFGLYQATEVPYQEPSPAPEG